MKSYLTTHVKALVAGLVAGLFPYLIFLSTGGTFSTTRLEIIFITAFGTAFGVHISPNALTAQQRAQITAEHTKIRNAGRRGRIRGATETGIGFLDAYLHSPLPAPSYPIDVSGGITAWGMLGNDEYGDCTFAGRQHNRMAKAIAAKITETWETAKQLVAEYLKYTGGKDTGASIPDLLLSWYNAGIIDGFAPVDITDVASMDAAMQAFNGLYVGVALTDDAEQLFENGQPWTTANGEKPDNDEGHCIVKVKATGQQDVYVTWGALQAATVGWSKACIEEAYVLLTKQEDEHLVDFEALCADIDAYGGKHITEPTPTPAPTPTPSTDTNPADVALAPVLERLLEAKSTPSYVHGPAVEWLDSHGFSS